MVLSAYRHGLRVSELVDLRWEQIDFRTANVHVVGSKQGTPSTHPILGDELRALRRLQREQEPRSPFAICLVVRVQRLFSLTRCCRGEAPGNHAGKWGVATYALKKTDTDQEHRGHRGHRTAIQHSDAPDAPYGPDAVLGRGVNSLEAKQPTASEPPMVLMPKESLRFRARI